MTRVAVPNMTNITAYFGAFGPDIESSMNIWEAG